MKHAACSTEKRLFRQIYHNIDITICYIHIRYYHVGEAVHDVVYHYHLVVHCAAKWSFVNSIRQMMILFPDLREFRIYLIDKTNNTYVVNKYFIKSKFNKTRYIFIEQLKTTVAMHQCEL